MTTATDANTFALLFPQDAVFEIRALKVQANGRGRPFTAAGWFSDIDAAARAVNELEESYKPPAIYVTLNPCNPALLARAQKNTIHAYQDQTTSDADIVRRRWLLIDCDPVRPAGVSSTDGELEAARTKSEEARDFLMGYGFGEPLHAMSGNGCHLLFPVDEPNDDATRRLFEDVLAVVADALDDDRVLIDRKVFNAARITKCYGTITRKGQDTEDRPHRRSELTHVPGYIRDGLAERTPREALERVASLRQHRHESNGHQQSGRYESRLMVDAWLREHGRSFRTKQLSDGRMAYLLDECPFNAEHGRHGETAVFQWPDGKTGFECKHNGCTGNRWKQAKEAIGRPDRERHYDPPLARLDIRDASDSNSYESNGHAKPEKRFRIDGIPSADFFSTRFDLEFLIEGVLVAGQNAILGGPQKALKTSIAVDAAISPGDGRAFLGLLPRAFRCPRGFALR